MPLSIQQILDSAGDKFLGWITNDGGNNVPAAPKGVNLTTQNGDEVADLAVSLDGETVELTSEYADGATFTRGSSKLFPGLAGIYESTVSTLTAGKIALARLTERGAVVQSPDSIILQLASAVEIRDTNIYAYDLVTTGGMSAAEVASATWTFFVRDRHDVVADYSLRGYLPNGTYIDVWVENDWAGTGSFEMILSAGAVTGSAGVGDTTAHWVNIPALAYPIHNWALVVQYDSAPTSLDLNVWAYGRA